MGRVRWGNDDRYDDSSEKLAAVVSSILVAYSSLRPSELMARIVIRIFFAISRLGIRRRMLRSEAQYCLRADDCDLLPLNAPGFR